MPPPPPQAETTPTKGKGVSFLAIQLSQQEQLAPVKDKRSLREIQDEERALQEEADFLKWWTAEEERVQQEALALAQFQSKVQTTKNVDESTGKKNRNTKPKSKTPTKPRADSSVPSAPPAPGGDAGAGNSKTPLENQNQNQNRGPPPHRKRPQRPRPKGNAE